MAKKAIVFTQSYENWNQGDIVTIADASIIDSATSFFLSEGIQIKVDSDVDDVGIAIYDSGQGKVIQDQDKYRTMRLKDLRNTRDKKLKEVDSKLRDFDWLDKAGTPATSQEQSDWATYRQDLLDITESFKADPSLLDTLDIESELPTKPV